MKNLPDDELFNSVENRLRDYSELPDEEVWQKISGALPPALYSAWVVWTDRAAAVLTIIILFFLFLPQGASNELSVNESQGKAIERTDTSDKTPMQTNSSQDKSGGVAAKEITNAANSFNFKVSTHRVIQVTENIMADANKLGKVNPLQEESRDVQGQEQLSVEEQSKSNDEIKHDSIATANHVLPPKRKKKRSRITLYSMVSPSLSFQHFTPESEDGVVVGKINSPGVISAERFGFSVDAGMQGELGKRFQYTLGMTYYHQSQQLEYEEKTDGSVVESGEDLNFEVKPGTINRSFDYSMRNIGVQGGIFYTLKQKGLMHKVGIVLQYQKGLMRAGEDQVYDNSSSDYLNYQLLYRIEYKVRSHINVFVQPGYTHSILSDESLDAPFRLKQSRASVGVGIVYSF